jgi:tRNA A37 threonylcarbamoyladenosine dehydratase
MVLTDLAERITKSHTIQLILIAALSTGLTAATILGTQRLRREIRVQKLKDSSEYGEDRPVSIHNEHAKIDLLYKKRVIYLTFKQLTEYGADSYPLLHPSQHVRDESRVAALAARAQAGDYSEDLVLEQLARNRVFLGDDGLQKVRDSFIIIVGCGGVGSHAAAALVRSGVGKIRLIDFDQVTLSSLNRHALATLDDVGTPKVQAIRKRLEAIAPWVQWDCRNELFSEKTADGQLERWNGALKPDYVIDAIDNIDTKVGLLDYCYKRDIKIVSAMGAGAKSDPTRIFVGDISTTSDDPLSKSTRIRLRQRGVTQGIPVIFSTEKWTPGKATLLPLDEEEFAKGNVQELGVLQNFRVRIMPVLGTMPAIFGMTIANHVMLEISGYPHEYVTGKSREKLCAGISSALQGQEERLVRLSGLDPVGLRTRITVEDVVYLVDEVFHGKSIVSGLGSRLNLVRWKKPTGDLIDSSIPKQKQSTLKLSDLVLMTKDEAVRHEKSVLLGDVQVEDLYDNSVLELVKRRFADETLFEQYR